MRYPKLIDASFVKRNNRFSAEVMIEGVRETVHVKNTGRLGELLLPGVSVFLEKAQNPNRKTAWDLVAVMKDGGMVSIDSQLPNALAQEWLAGGAFGEITYLKREKTFGQSRFDLYFEYEGKRAFMEVKGVTLNDGGTARFPDAPTERGVKHVRELIRAAGQGYEAWILFVIQMKGVARMAPNWRTHREFGEALKEAKEKGVHIRAMDCVVSREGVRIDREVLVEV
ncbi:MAG: DNA/RNA nuclease SfsA [Lachnospiraceae bacterium]|nr:DNA/RNA nuclease SfsA [Lachnospiraceae bacterium]